VRKGSRCVSAPLLAVCAGLCVALLSPSATGAEGSVRAAASSPVLELYALEAELAETRARIAQLAARRSRVAAERASARRGLAAAQRALRVSQRRLASVVAALYVAGEADPLVAVLGATSLDEALAAVDALERSARQNQAVGRQAKAARGDVARLSRSLEARDRTLASLQGGARRRSADLTAAVARQRAYLAELTRRESAARAAAAQRQARQAQRRSATLTAAAAPAEPTAPSAAAPSEAVAEVDAAAETEPEPQVVDGVRSLTVDAVAYSLPGNTASGLPVGRGVVAVDPAVIPLGTRLDVPGYGPAVASDVGTAVRGLVIDLWFPTLAEARAWGRRTVTITLQ
jgi:3D (Asp-Asp-Asp) domain-containing protein